MNVLDRFRLDGKAPFITGGSRGFGRAMALAAAEVGADIVLNGRDPDALAKTADEIRERGRQAWTFAARRRAAGGMRRPFATACWRKPARSTSSINNVGGRSHQRADRGYRSRAPGRRFVDLNLTHCFLCTKMIGGAMLARGRRPGHQHRLDQRHDRQSRHRRAALRNDQGGA